MKSTATIESERGEAPPGFASGGGRREPPRMDINVTFRPLEPTEAIKNHIYDKMKKIEKFFIKPERIHFILAVEHNRNDSNNIAEITLTENGNQLTAQEKANDMYAAIDMAIGKIERQLKKYKEKIKNHKTPSLKKALQV